MVFVFLCRSCSAAWEPRFARLLPDALLGSLRFRCPSSNRRAFDAGPSGPFLPPLFIVSITRAPWGFWTQMLLFEEKIKSVTHNRKETQLGKAGWEPKGVTNSPPLPAAGPGVLAASAAARQDVKTTPYSCAAATQDRFHTPQLARVSVCLFVFYDSAHSSPSEAQSPVGAAGWTRPLPAARWRRDPVGGKRDRCRPWGEQPGAGGERGRSVMIMA